MFKKALLVLAFLLLASSVFSVRLIDPISKELSSTDNFVGTVAPGNTIELIFSKELTKKFDAVELLTPLPNGFSSSIKQEKESIKLLISVPKDAVVGDYPITVRIFGAQDDERLALSFSVVEGSLDVSPSEISSRTTLVDSIAEYPFFFVNNTDADAIFTIDTDLPAAWDSVNNFAVKKESRKFVVLRRQTLDAKLAIYPRQQGSKEFNVRVSYENTSKDFSFMVVAQPTLSSKLSATLYGLPFYSFSLLPSYFVNAIVSSYFK